MFVRFSKKRTLYEMKYSWLGWNSLDYERGVFELEAFQKDWFWNNSTHTEEKERNERDDEKKTLSIIKQEGKQSTKK